MKNQIVMFIGHQMSLPTACGCEHVPFQGYSSTTAHWCTFFHLWVFKQCVVFPHSLQITNIIRSLVSFQTVRCPKNLSTLIANDSYHPITCEFSNSALSCKSFHINCKWLISSDHLWVFNQCVVFPHSLQMTNIIRSLVSFQTVRCLSTFIAND